MTLREGGASALYRSAYATLAQEVLVTRFASGVGGGRACRQRVSSRQSCASYFRPVQDLQVALTFRVQDHPWNQRVGGMRETETAVGGVFPKRHFDLSVSIRKEGTFSAERISMMSTQITKADKDCTLK